MSAWILIYWITTGSMGSYGGLNSTTGSVKFNDEAACHSAYQTMEATKQKDNVGIWGVCVPETSNTK